MGGFGGRFGEVWGEVVRVFWSYVCENFWISLFGVETECIKTASYLLYADETLIETYTEPSFFFGGGSCRKILEKQRNTAALLFR